LEFRRLLTAALKYYPRGRRYIQICGKMQIRMHFLYLITERGNW
jgi:hypothetical protein